MNIGAIFSGNGTHSKNSKYRYSLWRIWDETKPLVMFIGLNPSIYDDRTSNPTLSKLELYTQQWGYGGFYLGNLFVFISPYPKDLLKEPLPIGEDNDRHLLDMAAKCEIVVAAWGNDGVLHSRNEIVAGLFPNLHCLSKTQGGHPGHPLYLSGDLTPISFK